MEGEVETGGALRMVSSTDLSESVGLAFQPEGKEKPWKVDLLFRINFLLAAKW